MRITRATPAQVEAIAAQDRRLFPGARDLEPDHRAAWWVVDGRPRLGYCTATVGPEGLFLERAWLTPSLRGRGLQRRMIRVREAWGRRMGARMSRTYTWGGNVASMNSLIRCGYTIELRVWNGKKSWIHWRRIFGRAKVRG